MKQKKRIGILVLVILLAACVFGAASVMAAQRVSIVATQSGITVYENTKASIDATNAAEGYLIVKYIGGKDVRVRVQVIKDGGTTYTYDLNNKGNAETFPLTEGNGSYTIRVLENTDGTKYAIAHSATVNVALRDEFLPFLYANQYVNYTSDSAVVKQAEKLVAGMSTDTEKLTAIYNYVVDNFTYDYDKAATVQSGYIPVIDTVLSTKTGICFDYAAVMAAMLRSQNIPCKLVIGYAGNTYHAWVNVYVDGEWVDGAVFYNGTRWSLMDPTFISTGNRGAAATAFVGDVGNYSQKYAY